MNRIKNQEGYFLIDVLLVVLIVSIGILAIGQMIVMSTETASSNDAYTKAMQIANARLESLHSVTASDWIALNPTSNFQTVETLVNAISDQATRTTLAYRFLTLSNPAITDNRFTRTTEIRLNNPAGTSMVEVRVSVSWPDSVQQTVQISAYYIMDL